MSRRRVGAGAVVLLLVAGVSLALVLRSDDEPEDPDASAEATGLAERFGTTTAEVAGPGGPPRRLRLLLADTRAERRRGLMEVRDPDLGGHDGMLFAFPEDTTTGFWMRNTPMPLSIAYLDAGGELVSTADMTPCSDTSDCPRYEATGPFRFALEVPQGRLDDLGIGPGATVAVG
jgi:uncharacterized membrane protein (UPF0127 family)